MEPSPQDSVSVVIPTWNRAELALECLRSLTAQTHAPTEIILVDDGSDDGTDECVRNEFPGVRIVSLNKNSGFAVAVNAGIRQAAGAWIFLLNNDVTLDPGCLECMLEAAEASGADMVAPLLLWKDEPGTIYAAGDRMGINGRPESIGFRQPRAGFPLPELIFGVSAAAGLYRRRIFDAVGLLDETFVAYFEDSDLCFRARLAGFSAALAPDAVACHVGSASLSGKTWWRSAQCFRNHGLLLIKNMPLALWLRFGPWIALERAHQARMLFSSARTEFGALGAARVFLSTAGSLISAVPHALRERCRIQRTRQITTAELRMTLSK